ncbi:mitochondrial genome maintenance MGM101-domain-containing protein, partial [Aspergillus caelatus]
MSLPRSLRAAETLLSRTKTPIHPQLRTLSTTSHRQQQQQQQPPKPAPTPTTTNYKPTPPTTPTNSQKQPSPQVAKILSPTPTHPTTPNISKTGLFDKPLELETTPEEKIDWTRSFHGLSAAPFPKEAADILLAETDPEEVEIKPDGILYLPEIKYRRILNRAFGPGGWGLVPRSESIVTPKTVTREYALVCNGRLVSVARGEQDYFSPDGIPTATEGCRSNALVRCCKDLGIASELWDPRWIRKYKAQYTREVFVEHVVNKRKSKIWVRKDDEVSYPWKEL